MKFGDVLKKVGTAVFTEVVPGGSDIVNWINQFLPENKKLPSDFATGQDVQNAINVLPAEKQTELMEKEIDFKTVQIQEKYGALRAMLESDFKNPHTTRPKIAYGCFQVLRAETLIIVLLWAYGVAIRDKQLVVAVNDGWPFIAGLIAPFVTVLYGYFGILRSEHRQRLNAAQGLQSLGTFDKMRAFFFQKIK